MADESVLSDIEFLTRSEHRVQALRVLAEEPLTRGELSERTGASASTVGRILDAFESRQWVAKDGTSFEATQLGRHVHVGVQTLIGRMASERQLRPIWPHLPPEVAVELPFELLGDATVSVSSPDAPYRPIDRLLELLEGTSRFRFVGFELALFEVCRDELRDHILDGMTAEVVDPPEISEHLITTYPEFCETVFATGRVTVRPHDDLPEYGLSLFDERVAVCVYDRSSGTMVGLIDTDDPEVYAWAEDRFRAYWDEASTLDTLPIDLPLSV